MAWHTLHRETVIEYVDNKRLVITHHGSISSIMMNVDQKNQFVNHLVDCVVETKLHKNTGVSRKVGDINIEVNPSDNDKYVVSLSSSVIAVEFSIEFDQIPKFISSL